MESQPHNPEFGNNPVKLSPILSKKQKLHILSIHLLIINFSNKVIHIYVKIKVKKRQDKIWASK